MKELLKDERTCLKQLCEVLNEEATFLGCIEGNFGRAWVDQVDNPQWAVLVVADFCYLAGNYKGYEEQIVGLLERYGKGKILQINPNWKEFLHKYFSNRYKSFLRYEFKKERDVFNTELLAEYVSRLKPNFKLSKIDETLYDQIIKIDWAADGCCFYSSKEAFMKDGIGYVVLYEQEIVCIASSYTSTTECIDITIGTEEAYQRQGLALACASKLILECLQHNLYPNWSAANKMSVALAEKLGYHYWKEIEVYSIFK